MQKRPLGKTGLQIAPLVFGGNVLGWTIDERTGFEVLDAFVGHGFNAIDTADVYSAWVPGNQGGESETIIGKWLAARPGRREQVVIFTKVGWEGGLSASHIAQAAEASLRRLQTDYIDLYFAHRPDPQTPHEETLRAFEKLLRDGKVRSIGASNFDAGQLAQALQAAGEQGLPRYQMLQPEYNLYDRSAYEGELRDLCTREHLGVVSYYSLASGFLSGKYRTQDDVGKSPRGAHAAKYLDERGMRILKALDDVCARHGAQPAEVALAWLIANPGVTAPIASATSTAQVECFARAAALTLSAQDIEELDRAGA